MSEVTGVSQEMWCGLLGVEDHALPMYVKFTYSKRDPWAVKMTLAAEGSQITWVFARELLIEGTIQPAGHGDLRIWPNGTGQGALLNFEFHNATGRALVQGSRSAVLSFLKRALDLVPVNSECEHQDIDGALAKVFEGAA